MLLLLGCFLPTDPESPWHAYDDIIGSKLDDGDDTGDSGATVPAGRCAAVPDGVDLDQPDAGFLFTAGDVAPTVFELCLGLDDTAIAALAADPFTWVEATLEFGGDTWDVGVHLKGSESGSFRTLDEKASFVVKMDTFDDEQRFHGRKKLVLNSMIQDGSMLSEHVAYRLFEEAGVPSPRHGYTNVYVNGELYGLYGVVEGLDGELLNRLFPKAADGNLYEGGYGADLYSGREKEWGVQESMGEKADLADLTELTDAVEAAGAAGTTLALIDARFDRAALLGMWATELVIADRDAYTTAGNNFALYHSGPDAAWAMIPYGPDQSFWSYDSAPPVGIYDALYGRLAEDCRAQEDCSAALDEAIGDVLTTWDGIDLHAYAALTAAAIEDDCFADPRSSWGSYGCLTAQEETLAWIAARPDEVRATLGD